MTSAELVWRNAKTNFNGKVVKGHERKVFRSRRCDADSWNFKISSIQAYACALINASKNYNMTKKAFSHIWQAFNELVENGQLISSSEIFEELKDDDIVKWAKEHKDAFLPLSKEVQLKTTEILQQFPQIIKIQTKGSSNGDPFLIATAILEDGIIVTDEGNKNNGIPMVCESLGVEYMKLNDMLDEVLE